MDPIRFNTTLPAVADGLTGLGSRFGSSLAEGNQILDVRNPRLPELHRDVRQLTDFANLYTAASPDLWQALAGAVTTSRTLSGQHSALDCALLALAGFGNTAADTFERGGLYLVRGAADLVPTSATFGLQQPGAVLHHPQLRPEPNRPTST